MPGHGRKKKRPNSDRQISYLAGVGTFCNELDLPLPSERVSHRHTGIVVLVLDFRLVGEGGRPKARLVWVGGEPGVFSKLFTNGNDKNCIVPAIDGAYFSSEFKS